MDGHFPDEPEGDLCRLGVPLPLDLLAFHRMLFVKRLRTGPHTPWPIRAEVCVRFFKKFLSALVVKAFKKLDQTTQSQITPAQLMRKAATVRITQAKL